MNRTESDARTKIIYTQDTAAGIKAMLQAMKDSGELPRRFATPKPLNERPWHRHTLPNRKRRR
jgi:hypothetical protein